MVKLRRYNSNYIMDIDNGVYKDYYGYKLYELIENKIRPYGGGNYIYEIEDNKIRQYCGMPVLEFDGHFLRRYCGPIIYEVKDNVIKDYNSANVYEIEGHLSKLELMGLLAILFA